MARAPGHVGAVVEDAIAASDGVLIAGGLYRRGHRRRQCGVRRGSNCCGIAPARCGGSKEPRGGPRGRPNRRRRRRRRRRSSSAGPSPPVTTTTTTAATNTALVTTNTTTDPTTDPTTNTTLAPATPVPASPASPPPGLDAKMNEDV